MTYETKKQGRERLFHKTHSSTFVDYTLQRWSHVHDMRVSVWVCVSEIADADYIWTHGQMYPVGPSG